RKVAASRKKAFKLDPVDAGQGGDDTGRGREWIHGFGAEHGRERRHRGKPSRRHAGNLRDFANVSERLPCLRLSWAAPGIGSLGRRSTGISTPSDNFLGNALCPLLRS